MGDGLVWTWRIPYLRLATFITGLTNVIIQCVILLILVVATEKDRPAWAGVGGVGTVSAIVLTMARVRAAPDAALSRIVGAATLVTQGAVPVGSVVAGYLLASAAPETSAWIVFAAMVVIAVFCTRFLRPLDSLAGETRPA